MVIVLVVLVAGMTLVAGQSVIKSSRDSLRAGLSSRARYAARAFPSGRSVYGCWDMAGNVWEWTTSRWSESGPFIVQKGGSTVCSWPQLQCSSRMDAFPDFVLRWTGFRLKSDSPGYGVGDL